MIIDAHCHAGHGDGLTGPWDTEAPLDAYLDRAARAGISRTIIFPPFHSDYATANREIAAMVAARPDRFIGFACVHAERDRGRVARVIAEAAERLGLRGVKVHRHDARISREVCDAARAHRLPILYDLMGETAAAELFAEQYPDVPFIIPHLGSFADDWGAQRTLIDALTRRPNLFADTAGVRRFDVLEEAVHRAGAEKIIFGSDGPWLHPGIEIAKVRELHLPHERESLILGGNITRVLHAKPPAASAALCR